jgi:hypothetical protein
MINEAMFDLAGDCSSGGTVVESFLAAERANFEINEEDFVRMLNQLQEPWWRPVIRYGFSGVEVCYWHHDHVSVILC